MVTFKKTTISICAISHIKKQSGWQLGKLGKKNQLYGNGWKLDFFGDEHNVVSTDVDIWILAFQIYKLDYVPMLLQ